MISAAYMFTHTHQLGRAPSPEIVREYEYQLGWYYARAFNQASGRRGCLFSHSAGFAAKRTEKDIRTNLAYLANNSVEKRLFNHCWEDRWNFVAYAGSPSLFSEPLVRKKASRRLRSALKIIESEYLLREYLDYALLFRLFSGLSQKETQQLIDAIILIYQIIDYEASVFFYGSYEKMILAFDSNTGSEYGFTEAWEPPSDIPYRQMCRIVHRQGFNLVEKKFLQAPSSDLIMDLMRGSDADPYQIRRFLHIPEPPR